MSNYTGFGTITGNTSTDWVTCRGWVTLSMHIDSGTGTMTWNFIGVDGVERIIIGGTDNITAQVYTATHAVNVFFGSDVAIRGTVSSSSTPQFDWQIMGNPINREAGG